MKFISYATCTRAKTNPYILTQSSLPTYLVRRKGKILAETSGYHNDRLGRGNYHVRSFAGWMENTFQSDYDHVEGQNYVYILVYVSEKPQMGNLNLIKILCVFPTV